MSEGMGEQIGIFGRIAAAVLRARWWVLLGLGALTLFLVGYGLKHSERRIGLDVFLASDGDAVQNLASIQEAFGRDDYLLVVAEGDVFSMAFLEKLKALHQELESTVFVPSRGFLSAAEESEASKELDSFFEDFEAETEAESDEGEQGRAIDSVASLINRTRLSSGPEGSIAFEALLEPWPEQGQLKTLREEALADGDLVPVFLSEDGRRTVLSLRYRAMHESDARLLYRQIQASLREMEDEEFRLGVSGQVTMAEMVDQISRDDAKLFVTLTTLLICVVLAMVFRHPLGVIAPLLVVGLSLAMTYGLLALLGVPLSMMTIILPGFLLAVGIGDSVHVTSIYRDLRAAGVQNDEAIVRAVDQTGVPILFTTLTTVFGLISFWASSIEIIEELGTAGALGVSVALILTIVLLPAILSFNRKSLLGYRDPEERTKGLLGSIIRHSNAASMEGGGRRRVLGITLLACVLALIGIVGLGGFGGIRLWHDPISWVPTDQPDRLPFDAIDQSLGGMGVILLYLEAEEGDLRDLAFLRGLEALEAHVLKFEHPERGAGVVTKVSSLLDPIRELNQVTHDGDPAYHRLPDDQAALHHLFVILSDSAPDTFRRLMTIDHRISQLVIRTQWMDATSYLPLTKHLEAGIASLVPSAYQVRPTGSVYTVASAIGTMYSDFARSFGTAFLVIGITMLVLLRRLSLGLLAMVPNLLPIVLVLGVMGIAGVPLDFTNLMIGSILLGIAVDNTIHVLHHFREAYDGGADRDEAIARALDTSGRAVLSSGLILCLGFGVQVFATLYNFRRFGYLLALAIALAVILNLVVSPALLRIFYRLDASDRA